MNGSKQLNGIIAAAVTPLDEEERFVPRAYEALLDHLYSAGVDGVYVCGQTGEGLLQSVEQRKQVTEVSLRCSPGGKQVIVHVGAHRTADAVELASHASRLGATAVSALPAPGSYNFAEIRSYYEAIAAASDSPVLVYYFPDACPGIRTVEQILDLCSIPNIIGLKFTDFDLYRMRILKQSGAVVFNGRDEVLTAGLLMGADGGIGTFYNIVPELFVELYRQTLRRDWESARTIQDRINTLIQITLRFPLFSAIKQILTWMGIPGGPCIKPRSGLSSELTAQLRESLEKHGFVFDGAVSPK
jgi:N-acetylneuraminate lyase